MGPFIACLSAEDYSSEGAPTGQTEAQAPQLMQVLGSIS